MAEFIFANNTKTTLNEPGGVLTGDTVVTVDDGSVFPTPVAGKTLRATMVRTSDSAVEIVDITNIVTNDLTLVRAREGTSALAMNDGDSVGMRITKEMLESFQLYSEFTIPLSSEEGDAAVANAVTNWLPYYDYKLHHVMLTAKDAPTGSTAQVDINDEGVSMLSTKLTIDAGEDTSATAATPAVIFDDVITAGNNYTFDIDQVGATNPGKGYKLTLIVSRT